MNGDLISRSALLDVITTDGFEHFSGCLSSSEITLIELMRDSITEAPAVDAVQVVRCKDCKYYRTHGQIHGMCYYGTGMRFMFNDGFCSYGERRADE